MSSIAKIDEAFADRPELRKRLHEAISENAKNTVLFHDISTYVLELKKGGANDELASKKRKFDAADGTTNGEAKPIEGTWADIKIGPAWKMSDVSFSVPQRKKLQVEVVKKDSKNGVKKGGIRAVNVANGTVEFGTGWGDVDQVFCLPVPEKAKKQHNFIVIPRGADGITPAPEGTAAPEPIVWTYVEPTGKEIKEGQDPGPGETSKVIDQHLGLYGKKVLYPTEKEFASSIPQPHRKNEKAFHVKAFRGSKDGYLYFTSAGILFGFKKPLAYFPFDTITSVSYTSVLQRTFNLNIGVNVADQEQEIEFSMLDQADYSGINDYIRKHGLQDASLAATRKAKKLNINGPPKGEAENGESGVQDDDDDDDGETELQKAERLLQDEEDEEEEDYDPGSDDGSDGSGSSEDDEPDNDDAGNDDDEEDDEEEKDLVAEELGSQAEDVEMSDEEK